MVEHHIENDFDPSLVHRLDELFELAHLLAVGDIRRVGGVGREKRRWLVAPQVDQRFAGKGVYAIGVGLLELVYRKEFDRGHTQLLEVWDFLDQAGESAWVGDARGRMARETAHVRFINDAINQRNVELLIASPVEMVFNHYAVSSGMSSGLVSSPHCTIRDDAGVGIKQAAVRIKAINLWFPVGLHVEAKSVMCTHIESLDENVPYLSDAVDVGVKGDCGLNSMWVHITLFASTCSPTGNHRLIALILTAACLIPTPASSRMVQCGELTR